MFISGTFFFLAKSSFSRQDRPFGVKSSMGVEDNDSPERQADPSEKPVLPLKLPDHNPFNQFNLTYI